LLSKSRTFFPLASFLGLLALWTPITAHAQKDSSSARTPAHHKSSNPASSRSSQPASAAPDKYSKLLQPFLGNCCANSFLPPRRVPPKPKPPLALGYRLLWQENEAPVPIALPVYIPFAIGYVPEEVDQGSEGDDESVSDSSKGWPEPRWLVTYDADSETPADDAEEAEEAPEQPVVEQPATVLVFKDGRRANVRNYAILGDALFDFDDARVDKIPLSQLDLAATARTNDARGVEFKLPPGSSAGSAPN